MRRRPPVRRQRLGRARANGFRPSHERGAAGGRGRGPPDIVVFAAGAAHVRMKRDASSHAVQVANPARNPDSCFKHWHAVVATTSEGGAGGSHVCGACIWKIVKSGLCRYGCSRGGDAARKRGRRRLDYAELFFLYVAPEVSVHPLHLCSYTNTLCVCTMCNLHCSGDQRLCLH